MENWLKDPHFQRFVPFVERGDIVLKEWKLPARVPLPKVRDELDTAWYFQHPGRPNANGEVLVADSVFSDANRQEWLQIYESTTQLTYFTVAVSDAARLIILHLHRGIYLDMDIILLRDLRLLALADRGFAERWESYIEPGLYNTAVFSMPANSTISSFLLQAVTRIGHAYHPRTLGHILHLDSRDDRHERGLAKLF
jgi:hypothetical protein